MNTADLTGEWLDYWVARAEGHEVDPPLFAPVQSANYVPGVSGWRIGPEAAQEWPSRETLGRKYEPNYIAFSSNWQFGGPIIERERIRLDGRTRNGTPAAEWAATITGPRVHFGPTPLIAAMRAYVSSKFGDELRNNPA